MKPKPCLGVLVPPSSTLDTPFHSSIVRISPVWTVVHNVVVVARTRDRESRFVTPCDHTIHRFGQTTGFGRKRGPGALLRQQ